MAEPRGRAERVLVAAVARNGVIGDGLSLPFRLPSDLKRFRRLTVGKPVIMGRRTFQSIGRPLPDRVTIVVTSAPEAAAGVVRVGGLAEAFARAEEAAAALAVDEVIVAGGAGIYREALPLVDRLEITRVEADPAGDVRFPAIDPAAFREVAVERPEPAAADEHPFSFHTYRRVGPLPSEAGR